VLSSDRLIDTTRGASGGSTVRQPDQHEAIDMLTDNMRSLMVDRDRTTHEMEELRELLEVSATWLAASRRSEQQLKRIAACVFPVGRNLPTGDQIQLNLRFHYEILVATQNSLLHLFAEPILSLINQVSQKQPQSLSYYRRVSREHRAILLALRDRDQEAARRAMSAHVGSLRASADGAACVSPFVGLCFGAA
jgi:GntR family transcriptional repressor for pyruvate dehydrogenase complex